jgi:hypothetical protein
VLQRLGAVLRLELFDQVLYPLSMLLRHHQHGVGTVITITPSTPKGRAAELTSLRNEPK